MNKLTRKKDLMIGSLLFFSLMGLSFGGWYFASSPVLKSINEDTLMNTADLNVSQLTVKQFDTRGSLVHFIQSPFVKHIPAHDTHLITLPHIISRQPNKPLLEIRSLDATSIQGGKQITFEKQVVVLQKKTGKETSTMTTEELVYYPSKKIASTQKKIRFHENGSTLYSQGMKADLGKNQSIHLSKVRASHASKQG